MKYKAIIFDMDGTIITTDHIWNQATRDLITRRGHQISAEQEADLKQHLHGLAINESCLFIKMMFKLEDSVPELMKEKSKIACDLFDQEVKFIDGFLDFHQKVDSHKLKRGIATNADDNTLLATKKALKLEVLFGEHIYNISHVNFKGKPQPDIYLHAARQLGVAPEECIAIEDSAHGIRAAKAAGMLCIGIKSHGIDAHIQEADIKIQAYHQIDLEIILGIK
jgi:HAD superfamily hydrolase (TIGR01509 family)